jgi:hypothetical protein
VDRAKEEKSTPQDHEESIYPLLRELSSHASFIYATNKTSCWVFDDMVSIGLYFFQQYFTMNNRNRTVNYIPKESGSEIKKTFIWIIFQNIFRPKHSECFESFTLAKWLSFFSVKPIRNMQKPLVLLYTPDNDLSLENFTL